MTAPASPSNAAAPPAHNQPGFQFSGPFSLGLIILVLALVGAANYFCWKFLTRDMPSAKSQVFAAVQDAEPKTSGAGVQKRVNVVS